MFYDSDDEEFSVLDEISCEPIIETVNTKLTPKFVYDDAEELFLTAGVSTEPTSAKDTEPDIQQVDPEYVQCHEHVKDTLHEKTSDADSMTKDDTSYKMCPDFPQGEE